MTTEKLDFLEETASPEPEVQETAPEPEAMGAEEAAPPAATEEKVDRIPITALLDEREKRQAKEREAEEARREAEQLRRQLQAMQRPPQKAPDFFENPEHAFQARVTPLQQQMLSDRLDMSELMASDKHGAEVVEEAKKAFLAEAQRNPALHQQILRERHPYDAVVKWHKRVSTLSKIGDDPDAYINAEIERRLQERLSQTPAPHQPAKPPPSLSKAPAAGSGDRMKPGSAFDSLPIR